LKLHSICIYYVIWNIKNSFLRSFPRFISHKFVCRLYSKVSWCHFSVCRVSCYFQ
jgi:hypothetical protein